MSTTNVNLVVGAAPVEIGTSGSYILQSNLRDFHYFIGTAAPAITLVGIRVVGGQTENVTVTGTNKLYVVGEGNLTVIKQ